MQTRGMADFANGYYKIFECKIEATRKDVLKIEPILDKFSSGELECCSDNCSSYKVKVFMD
jgi:hypothetical protein